ncbi:hypothetical protein EVB91_226 [Rhizobium phage RHph_I1_18]|nr:hypothetical protein EVB91_226 [Rhizobium phage RHph_I1_18]
MIGKIRLRISTFLAWISILVAPREVAAVTRTYLWLVDGLPKEMARHRDGGVVVVPWATTKEGMKLALHLQKIACESAAKAREEYNA